MANHLIQKPKYTKHGFLVEFTKTNKNYFLYLFVRFLAFLFDFMIPALLQVILYYLLGMGFFLSTLITLIYYQLYFFTFYFLGNGKTFGSLLSGLRTVHKSGFHTTKFNYYTKSFIQSIYAIPFVGWTLMFVNGISLVFIRNYTFFDLITGTIVITERQYAILQEFEIMEGEQ